MITQVRSLISFVYIQWKWIRIGWIRKRKRVIRILNTIYLMLLSNYPSVVEMVFMIVKNTLTTCNIPQSSFLPELIIILGFGLDSCWLWSLISALHLALFLFSLADSVSVVILTSHERREIEIDCSHLFHGNLQPN